MKIDETNVIDVVSAAITFYLRGNPLATDTAEGIHLHWLLGISQVSVAEVQAALARLVEQGTVVCRSRLDGTQVY